MLLSTICSRAAWTFPKSTLVQGLRFTCRKPTQSLLATVTRCGCIQASRLFTSSNQLRGPGRISGIIRRSFATLGTPLSGHLSRGRQRIVGLWLLGCSGMVFVAVVLGGVTRLTESGLSMVDWHLLKGMAPPTTDEDWEKEFEKYKQYPEFRYKSLIGGDEMSLSEFKFIWMMEYMHRMWGRAIGLAFLAPMAVFWASKSLIGGDEMSLSEFKFIWMMEYMHRMWGRAIGLAFLAPMAVFWASKSLIGGDEMSLSEFKFIWMMEYMHRMWGRAIGLAFLAPMAVFWASKSLIGGDEMSLSEFKFIWMMEYMHRMWGRAIGLAFLAPMAVFWASKSLIGGDEMSLSEFKFIWMMEYMHRMWGRAIGLAFLAPMAVFWARGWFDAAMKKRMGLAGGLLIFQGLLGWYMVKSGLNPQQNSNADVPRVSQYRLALHLSSAFVLYTIFLWCGLSHVFTPYNHNVISGISKLRGLAHASKATMFLTAVMGAFVAGLDAGLTYNSWPKFADRWIPSDLWIPEQGWRNFTENATMVQFVHRGLAYATLAAVTTTWLIGRRMPLPFRSKAVLNSLFLVIYAQAAIGVFTLLHYVPVWLGALHQSGSLVSLTFAFWLTNELRRFPK